MGLIIKFSHYYNWYSLTFTYSLIFFDYNLNFGIITTNNCMINEALQVYNIILLTKSIYHKC